MLTLIVVCGLLYPLVVTGDRPGRPSPVTPTGRRCTSAGKLVGSKIIGQNFQLPVYKNGKPEMSDGEPVTAPTRGTSRRGRPGRRRPITPRSRRSPTTDRTASITKKAIAGNIAAYIQLNGKYYPGGLTAAKVPVDAADTSASGIDPDISVANAHIQAYRIAAVRHMPLATVDALISKYTAGRGLGFSGEPSVNVLELNLALNRL